MNGREIGGIVARTRLLNWALLAMISVLALSTCSKVVVPTAPIDPKAVLSATPAAVTFGPVPVGTTATYAVTLRNIGDYAATLTRVATTGAGFGVTHGCGVAVTVGGSCVVTVTYVPTTAVVWATGTLTVESTGAVCRCQWY